MKFAVEWLAAPEVTDTALRATWCRLSLQGADGRELFSLLDSRTAQSRSGVYGSALPLALWLVENYWSVLWEEQRSGLLRSGRQLARDEALVPWVQRHNFLCARGGFSLPDLTLARDGEATLVGIHSDSDGLETSRPVRFIVDRTFREPWREVRDGIANFVTAVLDQLRGTDGAEVSQLRENWNGIGESERNEAILCQRIAMMGLDPYSPSDTSEEVLDLLERADQTVGPSAAQAILNSAPDSNALQSAIRWVQEVCRSEHLDITASDVHLGTSADSLRSAHDVGYAHAQQFRRDWKLGNGHNNLSALKERFSLSFEREKTVGSPPFLRGVIGKGRKDISPIIVAPEAPFEDRRFRLARAFYLWYLAGQRGTHVLSAGHDRKQRESRAFAAEFLAPASGLREELRTAARAGVTGNAVLDEMAKKYQVRPGVIAHQLENHYRLE